MKVIKIRKSKVWVC